MLSNRLEIAQSNVIWVKETRQKEGGTLGSRTLKPFILVPPNMTGSKNFLH